MFNSDQMLPCQYFRPYCAKPDVVCQGKDELLLKTKSRYPGTTQFVKEIFESENLWKVFFKRWKSCLKTGNSSAVKPRLNKET